MTATSEAIKEYMVNAISMGIRPIGMKLGEDVDQLQNKLILTLI